MAAARSPSPPNANELLLRAILLAPTAWLALVALLVVLAIVRTGEWPHGHGLASADSCPRHTELGPLAHQYSSIDPKNLGVLYSYVWPSITPLLAATLTGACLLLLSIPLPTLRVPRLWWAAFLVATALASAILVLDLAGLRNWLAD